MHFLHIIESILYFPDVSEDVPKKSKSKVGKEEEEPEEEDKIKKSPKGIRSKFKFQTNFI